MEVEDSPFLKLREDADLVEIINYLESEWHSARHRKINSSGGRDGTLYHLEPDKTLRVVPLGGSCSHVGAFGGHLREVKIHSEQA